jgi:hypothetical protein
MALHVELANARVSSPARALEKKAEAMNKDNETIRQ